jgi:hypothetical protein
MAYRGDGATSKPPNENGCRLWTGGQTPNGYGLFYADGQMRPAHRWALEQANGPLGKGIDACHRCDVKLCVELAHLFPGTRKQNMQDAKSKGRLGGPRPSMQGDKHPRAVLTEPQVLAMRSAFASGQSMRSLSDEFGVTFQSVSRIVRNLSWRHL